MILKLLFELVDDLFTFIGVFILGIIVLVGTVIAFHYFPVITGILVTLILLGALSPFINVPKKVVSKNKTPTSAKIAQAFKMGLSKGLGKIPKA